MSAATALPSAAALPLAITMGDPCGIGPEIVAAQWLKAERPAACVVGSVAVMQRALSVLALRDSAAASLRAVPVPWPANGWQAALGQDVDMLVYEPPGLPAGLEVLPWGQVHAHAGQAAAVCVRAAAALVQGGMCRAMVTAPLHKEALALAGEPFPGHTELLQALATPEGQPLVPVRMMLANEALRVVLVSVHMPLRQALAEVTCQQVLQTIRIAHASLESMGVNSPRIAVAGLNPHAGEGGRFGKEDMQEIAPAVVQARAEGLNATGPWSPDTVFMRARRAPDKPAEFDAVIAMYHDQGLIPIKYLGMADGVNVTLGLPFVRTSPDHGTAFDLAGTGKADPASLETACRLALDLSARRQM